MKYAATIVFVVIILIVMLQSLNKSYNDKHKNELNYLAFDAGFDPEKTTHEFHGFSASFYVILFCLFVAVGACFRSTL